MVGKAKIYFADLSEGVGIVIERSFKDFPNPDIFSIMEGGIVMIWQL